MLVSYCFSGDSEKEARKLYNKAQKSCLAKKWDQAINSLQELIERFPNSRYQDDAQFWIAYNLEKRPDSEMQAFDAYTQLIKDFPNSSWVDDAIVHQIILAEKFVRQGKRQHVKFLVKKLDAKDQRIRQQAALSLGKLGDKRALPVLTKMKDDEDLGQLAQSITEAIEVGESPGLIPSEEMTGQEHLGIVRVKDKSDIVEKKEKKDWKFFFKTKRYKQYESMIKKDDEWTKDELIPFGLWHILPTEQFEEYFSLNAGYDRQEWLRKYWKQCDPTPTTETNERKIEFERRVNYARTHFSEPWNFRHFKYLRNQYLREGWEHAPWDARGETYIKYGEPDFQSIAGYHKEEWIYYRYNVDFIIEQYMTNIYANAISPGSLSKAIYRDRYYYVETNFIFNPEFRYRHDYQAEPIKNFELKIEDNSNVKAGNVLVHYKIPIKEFQIAERDKNYQIKYSQHYVVLNEDMREVLGYETTKVFTEPLASTLKKQKNIEQTIELNLEHGEYMFAIRINDMASKKLGIYVENFVVE